MLGESRDVYRRPVVAIFSSGMSSCRSTNRFPQENPRFEQPYPRSAGEKIWGDPSEPGDRPR
jgi:hypothetical protein